MKHIFTLLLALFLPMCFSATAQEQKKMQEVLTKISKHLDSKNGLRIEYQYSFADHKEQGAYYAAGAQFYLESESLKAWYDGRNLWLYVVQNGEINLTTPERAELAELNPLLALEQLDASQYHLSQQASKRGNIITAKPKQPAKSQLTWLRLEVDKDFRPLWVELQERGLDTSIRVVVTSLRHGEFPQMKQKNFFRYEENKLPGVEVIDLR